MSMGHATWANGVLERDAAKGRFTMVIIAVITYATSSSAKSWLSEGNEERSGHPDNCLDAIEQSGTIIINEQNFPW